MHNRVVITGYGAVTPLGLNISETWEAMVAGKSGIDFITLFDASAYAVKIAAEVKNFNHTDFMDPVTARYSDRYTQLAMAASVQAIEMSKLTIDDTNKWDIGILVSSGIGGMNTSATQLAIIREKGPAKVSPYTIPMMIADNAASRVSIKAGIMGANYCLVTACATGADSIGMAYRMIKYGDYKGMIAGGADAGIMPLGIAGFVQAGALSKNPDPQKASRPFDAKRDGFVVGEGAAVMVLENLDYALSRGAPILAEIVGYGATSDAYHITQPSQSGEAAAKAIELALAGIDRSQIDYINAHGTSTQFNDAAETKAIKRVFGEQAYKIPVSSSKSMVGHMLGAGGAIEAIVCCETINKGVIPPTINLENPDPDCDLDYVPNKARSQDVQMAMSNSFGFGGHNAVLTFSRYKAN